KTFDKTQKEMIKKSPDGSEFDVSLLYLSIKLSCKDVAPFSDQKWTTESNIMEYYITAIKNMRNNVLHGPLAVTDEQYKETLNNLRELLTGCLKTSGEKYGRDQDEVNQEVKHMNDDLHKITTEILVAD
ncbi:hypothetical protein OTU49_013140, partial [Cherax quadricarinatus]